MQINAGVNVWWADLQGSLLRKDLYGNATRFLNIVAGEFREARGIFTEPDVGDFRSPRPSEAVSYLCERGEDKYLLLVCVCNGFIGLFGVGGPRNTRVGLLRVGPFGEPWSQHAAVCPIWQALQGKSIVPATMAVVLEAHSGHILSPV